MIKAEDIKPIPKYILKMILDKDKNSYDYQINSKRFYAYLTKIKGELVKITVAVKNKKNKSKDYVYKQVAVHGVNWDCCLAKDMAYYYIGGYVVGWFAEGLQTTRKWYEYGKWYMENNNLFDPFAPIVNKEFALKFPQYKYSCADNYKYTDLLKYLQMYEQYPQAELLVKFGLSIYATSKQILKKIEKDKNFRKWLARNRVELANNDYYVSTILYSYKNKKPLAETQRYLKMKKSFNNRDFAPIREFFKGKKLELFFDYIDKQGVSCRTYLDYLNACKNLQIDMTMQKNLMPHDFKRWHDIRIDEYATLRAKRDAEKRKELYMHFEQIANKYIALQRNMKESFVVVIAKSPSELIREGEKLHHCVGKMNYDQKFVREETLIFFIRNKSAPNTPFVTMEYSLKNKKIVQCYTEYNSKPADSVLDFVNNKWLPYANRKLNKILKAVA